MTLHEFLSKYASGYGIKVVDLDRDVSYSFTATQAYDLWMDGNDALLLKDLVVVRPLSEYALMVEVTLNPAR